MSLTTPIAQALCAALELGPGQAGEIERLLSTPPNLALGDFAFPCFQLARQLRSAPPKIAAELAAKIPTGGLISRATAAGPYVNFFLNRTAATRQVIGAVRTAADRYGASDDGAGRTMVVEFSSPNIAKPFHFGHLRSTNIGANLARLFEFAGWQVVRRNYLGDWGTQFGFVIYAWRRWGDEAALAARAIDYLVELYVRAYRESEQDPSIRDQARELFRRLEQGDAEIVPLWQKFRELSLAGFVRTYTRLAIGFDNFDGEAAASRNMDAVIRRFVTAGVAVESEGALVVPVADVIGRDIAPLMLRKSDGASTYAARDCAEAIERYSRYRFDGNIYVVSRQEDYFAQLFVALSKLGKAEGWPVDWPALCQNVSFGFVRGMSTRKGEAVWLEDVLDEARDRARRVREEKSAANPRSFPVLPTAELDAIGEGVGQAALLYFDVSSRRLSDVSFDWDTVLQFEGNTGPYLQYAHARMCGIFRRAGEQGLAAGDAPAAAVADEEWALVLCIREFPSAVQRACVGREPHEISRYLGSLASAFNGFYNNHMVLDPADPGTSAGRLALVGASRTVLANGLRLLGIRPLEVM
ncbi:MAG: arginine--tRNA ligase [Gammaproteobacteria bacterium]|nr:arginine--tRNA ligase [Gammaproteobacteria bacterium]